MRAWIGLAGLGLSIMVAACGGSDQAGQTGENPVGGAGTGGGQGTGKGGSAGAAGSKAGASGATAGPGGSAGKSGTGGASGAASGSGGANGGTTSTGGTSSAGTSAGGTSTAGTSAAGTSAAGTSAAGTSAAGTSAAGTSAGGSTSGSGGIGTAGTAAVGGAGGAGGATCCKSDPDCAGGECVNQVCAPKLPAGQCWRDSDCVGGQTCGGAIVCPCGAMCFVADQPGTCSGAAGGGGGAAGTGGTGTGGAGGVGCCATDPDCAKTSECVNSVCEQLPPPGECWRDSECNTAKGETCNGALACPCGALCILPDHTGMCGVMGGTGGAAGSAGSGGSGGAPGCCKTNGDCPKGECVIGASVCESAPPLGQCWSDADCSASEQCAGAQVCPCGASCLLPDNMGKCTSISVPTACPASTPQGGDACKVPKSQLCEYGSDLRPGCRVDATCAGGTWSVTAPPCSFMPGPGQAGCPKMDITGKCASSGLECDMTSAGGYVCACGCFGPVCGPQDTWSCGGGSMSASCPTILPDAGQPCGVDGTTCDYGVCNTSTHASRTCTAGVWQVAPEPPCPL